MCAAVGSVVIEWRNYKLTSNKILAEIFLYINIYVQHNTLCFSVPLNLFLRGFMDLEIFMGGHKFSGNLLQEEFKREIGQNMKFTTLMKPSGGIRNGPKRVTTPSLSPVPLSLSHSRDGG